MLTKIENWMLEDALNLFAGKLLGEGADRKVFTHKQDPTLVIKAETGTYSAANVAEWDLWSDFQDRPQGRFLAPCVAISPYGRFLLQRRVSPVAIDLLPDKLPRFLADLKAKDFGWYDCRVVCCNYAYIGSSGFNMRREKTSWWGDKQAVPAKWQEGQKLRLQPPKPRLVKTFKEESKNDD